MKNLAINIVLAAALLASIYWGYSEHRDKLALKQPQATGKKSDGRSVIVTKYIDTGGKQHIVFKDNPKGKDGVAPAYVDSLQRGLNIAADKITDITIARITAEGKATLYKTVIDSLKRKLYTFQNEHLQATYLEGDTTLKYKYHITLKDVGYKKNGPLFGLLGATSYYHDIFTDDKDATLNESERYTVSDYRPTFEIKLQAKSFYGINTGRFLPGFGVDVGYKRITGTWSYFYHANDNRWTQAVGLKLDLLKYEH